MALKDHETVVLMKIASWNVNSIRARMDHVTEWLNLHQPDVLLMQELKADEFPALVFKALGYESAAVTQKAYNGVAVLSRYPIETLNTTLAGDEADSHARYLELTIEGIRVVNIYLPNGNPVGSEKFAYKLAWMDRLITQMSAWREQELPVVVGGDFNVIPEDIDCHKPSSWIRDALFQPEPRARYRTLLGLGYIDAFRSLHPDEAGSSHSGITFDKPSSTIAAFVSTIFYYRQSSPIACNVARSIAGRERSQGRPITRRSSWNCAPEFSWSGCKLIRKNPGCSIAENPAHP